MVGLMRCSLIYLVFYICMIWDILDEKGKKRPHALVLYSMYLHLKYYHEVVVFEFSVHACTL